MPAPRRPGFGRWIGAVIDVPADVIETIDRFWSQALGWKVGQSWRDHPEFHHLDPPQGHSYVLIQSADITPRVHLDLYAEDVPQASEWMVRHGATLGQRYAHWQVLTSPVGFEFCVVQHDDERARPQAQTWPGGHRSRLVQVALDVPHGRVDEEFAFWRTITGWEVEESERPEFAGHLRPGKGGSLQLLVQELGADDTGTTTRAHLDLGTDDQEAEVARLERLGASRIRDGHGWVVLRDPAGLTFCVTGQSP